MPTTREILLSLVILGTPFQDTILMSLGLGNLGRSFAVVPLLLLALLDLCSWLAGSRHPVPLSLIAAGAYCTAITVGYFAHYGTQWNEVFLPSKAISQALTLCLAIYVVFALDWSAFRFLRISLYAAFAITVLGVAVCDGNVLGLGSFVNTGFLHQTPILDQRWRGFTSEASALSLTAASLGILSAAHATGGRTQVGFIGATALFLAAGGSKGGILALLLVGAFSVLTMRGQLRRVAGYLLLFAPVLYLAADRMMSMSTLELLSETTTLATRGTLAIWAGMVVMHNPLGVGLGGFHPALSDYLPDAMRTAAQLSSFPLNFDEVIRYLATSENASAKTMLMNFGVYFGLPFLICFFVFVSRIARACIRSRRLSLLAAILFVTIALCTYSDSLVSYNVLLAYGLGWREYRLNGHTARN